MKPSQTQNVLGFLVVVILGGSVDGLLQMISDGKHHQELLSAYIQHQESVSSLFPTLHEKPLGNSLIMVNERYYLEYPIQLPSLPINHNLPWQTLITPWQSTEHITSLNDRYRLDNRFGAGGCGEVWIASDIYTFGKLFVLKRIFSLKMQSGWREIYFGELLKREGRIGRFIGSFSRISSINDESELWLVFEHEGTSLHQFLYLTTAEESGGRVEHSNMWKKMRETGEAGAELRREMARQLVLALLSLHKRNIVHRDIKPSNIVIHQNALLKLIDFGSAIDLSLVHNENDEEVFSRSDHSLAYEPPEFHGFDHRAPLPKSLFHPSYDSWSLGVVLLEILLGTDKVFDLSEKQKRQRQKSSRLENELETFGLNNVATFNASVLGLDVEFHRGFFDSPVLGHKELDFVFSLLQLDPLKRLSMEEALRHPYLHDDNELTRIELEDTSQVDPKDAFHCETCDRKFSTYHGCLEHVKARRHFSPNKRDILCPASPSHRHHTKEICEKQTELGGNPIFWCGNRGGKRYSEDFFMNHNETVFAVADGHLGETAARFVVPRAVHRLSKMPSPNFTLLFREINEDFFQHNPHDQSGTALTVAIVTRTNLTVANVGDVRALVCCNGSSSSLLPIVLTEAHMASTPSEIQRIESKNNGGYVSLVNGRMRLNGILALSRAFGNQRLHPFLEMDPHVSFLNLSSTTRFLVMATDGLTDAMSDADIVKICVRELELSETLSNVGSEDNEFSPNNGGLPWFAKAAQRLIFQAIKRGISQDNLGVAVIPLVV